MSDTRRRCRHDAAHFPSIYEYPHYLVDPHHPAIHDRISDCSSYTRPTPTVGAQSHSIEACYYLTQKYDEVTVSKLVKCHRYPRVEPAETIMLIPLAAADTNNSQDSN